MILRIILWSIVLIFIVRLVVRFLFPILQITKMAQDRMQQMQQQMNEMQQKTNTPAPTPKKPKAVDGDYIEYEEVK